MDINELYSIYKEEDGAYTRLSALCAKRYANMSPDEFDYWSEALEAQKDRMQKAWRDWLDALDIEMAGLGV